MVEYVRIPRHPTPREETAVSLYLSGLINNVLCIHGAKSVSIVSEEMKLPRWILTAIEINLFVLLDDFSNMSLLFLHALVEQRYHTKLTIDTDSEHAEHLRRTLDTWDAAPIAGDSRPPCGMALAINIGQRMTSHGLVAIDARGRYCVERLRRVRTTDAALDRRFVPAFEKLIEGIRDALGDQAAAVEAIGLSLSATVVAGTVMPVRECGLFAMATPDECAELNSRIHAICRARFPGRTVEVRNDGEAQALFAFHYTQGGRVTRQAGPGRHLLSLRLGACPCAHCLDERGRAATGFQEFGWLVTALNANPLGNPLFVTTRRYLAYRGVVVIAHELGLLEKYRIRLPQECEAFPGMIRSGAVEREDAARIFRRLGGHMAMLAHAVHRHQPLAALMLLGSRNGVVDETVFPDIREGYGEFIREHALPLEGSDLLFTAEASPIAGLVGVAHAALAAAISPEPRPSGRRTPGPGR